MNIKKNLHSSIACCLLLGVSANSYSNSENWDVEYNADSMPSNSCSVGGWIEVVEESSPGLIELSVQKGLFVIDSSAAQLADKAYYYQDWNVTPEAKTIVEARVKQEAYSGGTNYFGTYYGATRIRIGNGINDDSLVIGPERIELFASQLSYEWQGNESASDFHVYRIEAQGNDIKVYVDGELKINGEGRYGEQWWVPENRIGFGEATGYASGRSVWDYVKFSIEP